MVENTLSGSKVHQRRIPAISLIVNAGASQTDIRGY
jgi:hypothetical protein